MNREDLYTVRVTVDGRDLGLWQKKSGGLADSTETKFNFGGVQGEVPLGGSKTTSNVQVSKLVDEDVQSLAQWLRDRVGISSMTVAVQPVDINGQRIGKADVYIGLLKSVQAPDVDRTGSSPALITLEQSTASGTATA